MKVLQSNKNLPLPVDQAAFTTYERDFAMMRQLTEDLYAENRLPSICPPNWKVNIRIHADGVSYDQAVEMLRRYHGRLSAELQERAPSGRHGMVWSSGITLDRRRSEFWKFQLFFCLDTPSKIRHFSKELAFPLLGEKYHAAASRIDLNDPEFRNFCNWGEVPAKYRTATFALMR